jgi:tetratricopeptide (TPR) repeat protein
MLVKINGSKFRGRRIVFFFLCAALVARTQQTKSSIASIELLIRSQQYDQALDVTRSALHETPKDFRLWTLEGIVLSIKGDKQDALSAFEKALGFSPDYPAALKGKVELLYEARDKRAIPVLKEILSGDPKDETAHEMLAILEQRQGNCQGANENFLLSADKIRTHPDSLEAYGYCLVQTKQAEKAIPVFEQLVALRPERAYPKYDLAVALVEVKQYEAALKILEPLVAVEQPDPDVLSLASEAYEAVRATPKAVALLRQAIVLSPATTSYYVAFATLCLDHDSFQVGIDMLNAGLKRISDDPSLYISRGLLYAQLAQFDLAEDDFKKAEQLDSAQSLSSYALDLAELERNNPDKALLEVRSQLKAFPDSPLLHYLLAKLLWDQRSGVESHTSDEAMKSAFQALKIKPDMVEARDLLANMYIRSEQYKLAIEQCRLALHDDPSDQSAMYHLIIALRYSGPEGQREMKTLVKQLSELKQTSRQLETERKQFQLIEQEPPPTN